MEGCPFFRIKARNSDAIGPAQLLPGAPHSPHVAIPEGIQIIWISNQRDFLWFSWEKSYDAQQVTEDNRIKFNRKTRCWSLTSRLPPSSGWPHEQLALIERLPLTKAIYVPARHGPLPLSQLGNSSPLHNGSQARFGFRGSGPPLFMYFEYDVIHQMMQNDKPLVPSSCLISINRNYLDGFDVGEAKKNVINWNCAFCGD